LAEEDLLAAARGDEEDAARAHLAGCEECREAVAVGREGLDLAYRAGSVPEPSPLYWESFRVQVGERIAAERATSWPVGLWRRFGMVSLVPAIAMAAVLVAVLPTSPGIKEPTPSAGPLLPAWQALPAPADDGGLDVLRGLALEGTDLQAATECRGVVECLDEMNDEESQDVADGLRGALPGGRS
jgi:hypothetical protein